MHNFGIFLAGGTLNLTEVGVCGHNESKGDNETGSADVASPKHLRWQR